MEKAIPNRASLEFCFHLIRLTPVTTGPGNISVIVRLASADDISLNGDVTARTANAVMHSERIGPALPPRSSKAARVKSDFPIVQISISRSVFAAHEKSPRGSYGICYGIGFFDA
jgi:hypothetical protein